MPLKDPEKRKAYQRAYMKAYYTEKRKAYRKAHQKAYRQRPEVREKRRKYQKKYTQRPEVKKRLKEYEQRTETKNRRKVYTKTYEQQPEVKKRRLYQRKHDPVHNKRKRTRHKVSEAVIHQRKFVSTIHKLIGCDVPTARAHLEAQFEEWMTWENYGRGKGKWCIDHIIPVASIDIFNEDEVKRIFHYTNMQPLEFCKNCEKGTT